MDEGLDRARLLGVIALLTFTVAMTIPLDAHAQTADAASSRGAVPAAAADPLVVFLGDSLTAGLGVTRTRPIRRWSPNGWSQKNIRCACSTLA